MTQLEKQQHQIDFFVKFKFGVHEQKENVQIVRYDTDIKGETKPAAALFIGRAAKPFSRHYYLSEDKRELHINKLIEIQKEKIARKKLLQEKRKAFIPTSKAGDIFVSSWGYEQTQVDFYLLQSVKGKTGTFIKIGLIVEEGSEGHDSCKVLPNKDMLIGKHFKKLITQLKGVEKIRLASYEYCHKWNGQSKYKSWYY